MTDPAPRPAVLALPPRPAEPSLVARGVSLVAGGTRSAVRAAVGVLGAAARSGPVRAISRATGELVDAVAAEAGPELDALAEEVAALVGRMAEVVAPRVVEAVDPDALLDRVDVNALLDRVDVDRLLERVDVDRLMERVQVGGIVTEGAGQVAGSVLDLARRQGVGVDVVLTRAVDRLLGRDPDRMPRGPAGLVDAEPDG